MAEQVKPIKLLLKAKPFSCECGVDLFIPVFGRDEWECNGCGAKYNGRDGKKRDFGTSTESSG